MNTPWSGIGRRRNTRHCADGMDSGNATWNTPLVVLIEGKSMRQSIHRLRIHGSGGSGFRAWCLPDLGAATLTANNCIGKIRRRHIPSRNRLTAQIGAKNP
ncbi:MAG: hypothetical protein WAL87_08945 [Chthoniobacterales bacterium]